MTERQRRWSFWVEKGAVAMATLAALALAVTVFLASRALDSAADVVVLGDGEALISGVVVDLWQAESTLNAQMLATVIAKHEAQGLRHVALVDRQDQHLIAQAGSAAIASSSFLPGQVERRGRRVRLVALIPPRSETRARTDPGAAIGGPPELAPFPRPHLVVEFEPPLIERLQKELTRISLVATVAALILVVFAFAWSRTTARLSAMREQAERERRLVELGRASSVIAHELRNPLTALKGYAQLLAEDLVEPARAKALRVVVGAERLERLTTVLLDFVRDAPLDLQPISPVELVERALAQLPKGRVHVDLSGAPESLRVDPDRMSLALRNLVENGVQATPDEAEQVEVRATGDEREIVLEVRDHGTGLASATEAQIFEPFVTTKARGTGLGLAIARRIAEQHHGTLTGETHAQGGAIFRLVLPRDSKPGVTP
jgi:two-component system, NtrC family, sensor histidine kinase HydH